MLRCVVIRATAYTDGFARRKANGSGMIRAPGQGSRLLRGANSGSRQRRQVPARREGDDTYLACRGGASLALELHRCGGIGGAVASEHLKWQRFDRVAYPWRDRPRPINDRIWQGPRHVEESSGTHLLNAPSLLLSGKFDPSSRHTQARIRAFADPVKKRRWYVEGDHHDVEHFEMDFRVGGKELARFRFKTGTPIEGIACSNDTFHWEIVSKRRIVHASTMTIGEKCISASLATMEFLPSATGTDLILTHPGPHLPH